MGALTPTELTVAGGIIVAALTLVGARFGAVQARKATDGGTVLASYDRLTGRYEEREHRLDGRIERLEARATEHDTEMAALGAVVSTLTRKLQIAVAFIERLLDDHPRPPAIPAELADDLRSAVEDWRRPVAPTVAPPTDEPAGP